MKAILGLALQSAWNRRTTLLLVVLSVALSTFLLLSVERIRTDVRENFSQSVSGTDLIIGARTGSMQLMLYAVFRVGGATNNVRMDSLQAIASHRAVSWLVPLSLGDSHRGFPVLATTADYFNRFLYGDRQPLVLANGRAFAAHWTTCIARWSVPKWPTHWATNWATPLPSAMAAAPFPVQTMLTSRSPLWACLRAPVRR